MLQSVIVEKKGSEERKTKEDYHFRVTSAKTPVPAMILSSISAQAAGKTVLYLKLLPITKSLRKNPGMICRMSRAGVS